MGKILNAGVWVGVAAVIVLGGAAPARADETIMVTVPFDFIVNNSRFPAGRYVVAETARPEVVSIESADQLHRAYLMTIPDAADKSAEPELVFERFGPEHFLARIAAVDGESREIPLTAAGLERQLRSVRL
jgi:hypothetical protein